MATVQFDSIHKRFGQSIAVNDFTLDVADGEFIVLVGPSGCGKTTTLRILAGLEDASSGTIRLGDKDITHARPGDRNLAMVFQTYALYPHMSVRENVSFALKLQKLASEEIEQRVLRAAKMLDIQHLLERKPRELSGGQRQRVAVCRAIVREPQAFLFDEPLSNLDAKLRTSARSEIRNLQQRLGVTTIYVTHDQIEAMTMADRIVVMNDGRIQQVGAPLDIYAAPANVFVASFLGNPAMNLIPAKVTSQGNEHAVLIGPTRIPVRGDFGRANPTTLGIRPEHLRVGDQAHGLKMQARVDFIESLGAETLFHVHVGETPLLCRLPGPHLAHKDEVITLGIDPADICFFGTDGNRLQSIASPSGLVTSLAELT